MIRVESKLWAKYKNAIALQEHSKPELHCLAEKPSEYNMRIVCLLKSDACAETRFTITIFHIF